MIYMFLFLKMGQIYVFFLLNREFLHIPKIVFKF